MKITGGNLQTLGTAFNAAFQGGLGQVQSQYTQIATVVTSTTGIGRAKETIEAISQTMTMKAIGPPNAFLGSKALRMPAIRPTGSATRSGGIAG